MDGPSAATAHQAEATPRARRYTGTAVSAKRDAFAALWAPLDTSREAMIAASMIGKRGPKPKC